MALSSGNVRQALDWCRNGLQYMQGYSSHSSRHPAETTRQVCELTLRAARHSLGIVKRYCQISFETMFVRHRERHRAGRTGWLRASVLGANDGLLSTASLVLGVAAAHATHSNVLVAGIAGLVAGSMSMAAGEYVSVHSQADTEQADLALERAELKADDKGEHKELMAIYVGRGLKPALAKQVAEQLMDHDALGAHARDELGISETFRARPIQAALASAGSFAVGAALPLLVAALVPTKGLIPLVSGTSLLFLALLGGLAARAGGAGVMMGAIRVTFWGALAMAVTAGVGWLFGTVA
jgi:vacuolar iron transporter family protein